MPRPFGEPTELAATPPGPLAATPLVNDERWLTVKRIADNPVFHRSNRLRELLLYIAERSLTGDDDQLTEYEIGRHLFGRGERYLPADDSVVRSSVRQLRLKLREYFDLHPAEHWRIEIPKGRYIANFESCRAPQPEDVLGSRTSPREGPLQPAPPDPARRNWPALLLAALCLLSLALNARFYLERQHSLRAAPVSDDQLGLAPALNLAERQIHSICPR